MGRMQPVVMAPKNPFFHPTLHSSAFLSPFANMWGWLGFELMMRNCLTRATYYTAIMPTPRNTAMGQSRFGF